jgi:hypothetical protein
MNVGPDRAKARHAGSGFYYKNQKPKPAMAWFFGLAHDPDPEPAHRARPAKAQARSVMPEPDLGAHYTGPIRPYMNVILHFN